MEECKYFFRDLVYVDFGYEKIIGEIQSHRITKEGRILYNVSMAGIYAPVTMIHKLTNEQKDKYNKFLNENIIKYHNDKEAFIKEMQKIFID